MATMIIERAPGLRMDYAGYRRAVYWRGAWVTEEIVNALRHADPAQLFDMQIDGGPVERRSVRFLVNVLEGRGPGGAGPDDRLCRWKD